MDVLGWGTARSCVEAIEEHYRASQCQTTEVTQCAAKKSALYSPGNREPLMIF